MAKFIMHGLSLDDNIWTAPSGISYYFRNAKYNQSSVVEHKGDIDFMRAKKDVFTEVGVKEEVKKITEKILPSKKKSTRKR